MAKYQVTTLTHKIQTLVRNLLCLLNVTLWLFVLYFSTHEDKVAAVLSYLSVMLTVILIKYGFGEIKLNEAFACLVDTLSKTLILTGIPLALLSESWNTAFYSICLGFIIQKMKYETQSESDNEGPSQSVKMFYENIKTDMFEAYEEWETYFQFQNVVKEKIIDNLRDLNKDRKLSNKDGKVTNCIRNTAQIVKRMRASSDETGNPLEIFKIKNSCKEKHLTCIQNLENSEGCNGKDTMLHADNTKNIKEKGVKIASTPEQTENAFEPKTESTNLYSENKLIEIASLCVLKAQILKIQELELNECYKTLSDCKSDETVNVEELKRNEMSNTSEEVIVLNDEKIKLSKHGIKQIDSRRNMAESQSEDENMLKTGFSDIKVNICSNVSPDTEKSSSNFEKHNILDHQNEINQECAHTNKDSRNSFKSGISYLDIILPHKQDGTTVDTNAEIEEPEILLNKRDLQGDTLVEINGNSNARKKYETTIAESTNVQPELTCEYQTGCKSGLNYDENMKTVFEECDLGSKSEDSPSQTLQSSCIVSYLKSSPKDNEATVNADDRNETELVKAASEEVSATLYSEVSDVEDVVNRIDLGFIYSLGFNVPA